MRARKIILPLQKEEMQMENIEDELQHESVDRDRYTNEVHYLNEVEFNIEFDKLVGEYDFLTSLENYREQIPLTTIKRYNTFKKSVARYYYLRYLQEYNDLSVRGKVANVTSILYLENFQMVNNPKLDKKHRNYNDFYLGAIKFINEFVAKNNSEIVNKYSNEDVESMLYLLHRDGYFKTFTIPDDAYSIESNAYANIGKVYAKYFLFADFINEKYQAICKIEEGSIQTEELVPTLKSNTTRQTKKETRTVANLINKGYADRYNAILKTLSESNPLLKVVSKPEFKSERHKLTGYKSDLSCFKKQMVYTIAENKVIMDENYQNLDTFLMYLFSYLIKEGWMKLVDDNNISATVRIINNTFFTKSDENIQIGIDRPQFNTILNKMLAEKVPEDYFHLMFIKMIVS